LNIRRYCEGVGTRTAKDALFEAFASIGRALSSGRRLEIVEVLAQGERSVEEVASAIDQSVANTSHHLRTLARSGLVRTRREGTHVHYRLASDEVAVAWLAMRKVAAAHAEGIDDLAQAYLGDRRAIESISRRELLERMESGNVVLIDVRPASEYAAGHLPGAISVPPDELELLDDLLIRAAPADEIVAYCRGVYCVFADDAVRHLAGRGRRARRLDVGMTEWRLAGGRVEH
jgi:rhodanese-related sulfurtransferase/predicted transcriptional regulator